MSSESLWKRMAMVGLAWCGRKSVGIEKAFAWLAYAFGGVQHDSRSCKYQLTCIEWR